MCGFVEAQIIRSCFCWVNKEKQKNANICF